MLGDILIYLCVYKEVWVCVCVFNIIKLIHYWNAYMLYVYGEIKVKSQYT